MTDAVIDGAPEVPRRYAGRLIKEGVYVLGKRRIEPGRDYVFTEAEMLHLMEHAVDVITITGSVPDHSPMPTLYPEEDEADRFTYKDKFEFRPLGDEEELPDADELDNGRGGTSDADRRARARAKVRPVGSRDAERRRERHRFGAAERASCD